MLRRILAITLVGLLLPMLCGVPSAAAKDGEEVVQQTEKARSNVARLGVGKDARVEVKLRDNTKFKGYVSEVGRDTFAVTDEKTGASRTVAYADVAQVSRRGNGLSTRTKALIGAAVATGVVVTWLIVKPALCDGGAQSRGPC
ncbi:MAG TPA: hypothetical protein VGV59_18895 [Pyrinomonadaceae bacterium]|nr:hypothetical protein [Pyrinomonadaceae bacterium]